MNRAAAGEADFWENRLDGVVIDYDALDVGNYADSSRPAVCVAAQAKEPAGCLL